MWLPVALICICLLPIDARSDSSLPENLQASPVEDFPVLPARCDQFFFGTVFPLPNDIQSGLVKLCQTQQHDGYVGPEVYATLFSTTDRIPVYSASMLMLYPNSTGFKRPDERYWERVSSALCNIDHDKIPEEPVSSRIKTVSKEDYSVCAKLQALDSDYGPNWKTLGVDRGHLNPNAINYQDKERQVATFSLTNAAPQFSKFNEETWEEYECMTRHVISTYVPVERVYIITGTLGFAKDDAGKPLWMNADAEDVRNLVRVPGYYWKAVCYPGSPWSGTSPWSYTILAENVKDGGVSRPDGFVSTRDFSDRYFRDDLFHERCLNATMGPMQSYLKDWKANVARYCHARLRRTGNVRWPAMEEL